MIIGVSGKAGSGKDTVADFLVRDHRYVKVSLADPLKRICADVFQFSDDQLWGPSEKRNEPDLRYHRGTGVAVGGKDAYGVHDASFVPVYLTPRHALQQLGTEWGRSCYANVWVEYCLRVAKELLTDDPAYGSPKYTPKTGIEWIQYGGGGSPAGVVIPDVRFRNEIEGLKAGGAKLIRVKRPTQGLEGAAGQHRSELEQDDIPDSEFDFILNNEGSLEELELQVKMILRSLRHGYRDEREAEKLAQVLTGIDLAVPGAEQTSVVITVDRPAPRKPDYNHAGLLSELFAKREEAIKSGRLMEYDPDQDPDVPPHLRKKKS